jgi:hypothetical protein
MQWILQSYEDTHKLAEALDRVGIPFSWHKVVPFVGTLEPQPIVENPDAVVMFGAYSMWRTAEEIGYKPGVFRLRPFVGEAAWQPYLLNGPDARLVRLRDIPSAITADDTDWFVRPVEDNKEIAGTVMDGTALVSMAEGVLKLEPHEIPLGSLRHDTELMLCEPVRIMKEWSLWAVGGRIVTWSLYKEGARVVYRPEIDDDALEFAQNMVDLNPGYSDAFVIDVCRTADGLFLLETNNINSAGFYAADLAKLVMAIEGLGSSLA